MTLGEKIYNLRKKNGMSQYEVAQKVGVSRQAVSKWELDTSKPDLNSLKALADMFEVTTDFLLNDELNEGDIYIPSELLFRALILIYKNKFRKTLLSVTALYGIFIIYNQILQYLNFPIGHDIWKTSFGAAAPLWKFRAIFIVLFIVCIYLEKQIINLKGKPKE